MTLKHELTPLQIDGSKAGSGKARQPTRENDSASTLATMSILYGLSEGVVRGFGATFTLDDVKKRLYMDGTPVMAADGTMLQEVEVDFRDGSVQQTPIEGMPAQTVETAIDLELRAVAPISRTFNRAEVDSFEVRISIPQLVTNTIDGDSLRRQVEFAIDIATDSGSFSEYGRYTIYEKITQGFQRTYPVQIPKAGTRTIRVRRLTPDNTSDLSVDKIIVEAMVEVVEVQFTYPHTALLWVRYDARNYSSVPKMELLMDGKADLRLPANYNPETREYATTGVGTTGGVWDGTWKIGYSDNPVWHWFDLATSARYGTGNRITIDIPDKFYLYSLARYCDELVPDGAGGYEPRFTCNNLYLQAANDAFQVFKDISSIFRAKTVWDGAHLNPKMDVPRDAMLVFSRANVSNVKYSSTSDSAQHNLIGVQYYDTANQYKSKYAYARDLDDIRQRGRIVDTNVSALGCTSEGQAQRMATYLLQSELKETRIISFTTGLDGMRPIIGDVFIFGDDLLAGKTTSGRVVSVAGNVVTLDRELTPSLDIGGTFIVNTTENFASTRKIVAIDPDNPCVVTLDTAITVVDITELVWAVRSVSVGLREYTIDDIEYDSDAKLFNISGVQYARDKYPASDGAARVENAPVTIIDPLLPSAPASVVASYFVKVDQGINIAVIDVAWTQVAKAAWYELEMRRDGSPWQSLGRVVQMTFSVDNAYLGIYEFRVRAIDAMSTASAFATSQPLDVRGKILPPPALDGIRVEGKLFGANIDWVFPAHSDDCRATRLRVTFQNPAETLEPVVQVYDVSYPAKTFTIDGMSPNVNVWVQGALVDSYGTLGAYTSWAVGMSTADATQILEQLNGQLTSEQLDQDLQQSITLGANAAATAAAAQYAADLAALAASNAQTAADRVQAQVTATTTELRGLLDITSDGLTQEILDRQEGDANVIGQLTTYKTSNDAAMSAVQQKAEAATSAAASNATALTNLTTEVTTANNLASNALQQAQSATDATSTNASNLIALNSRMDSAVQAGDNLLVNSNVDKPYNGNYPHGVYALGESWEVGATYTLLWCASFVRKSPDQNILVLSAYAGGGWQNLQHIDTEGERQVHEVTFVVHPDGAQYNEIHFYLLNSNGGYLDAVATIHWAVLVKASDISTKAWVRSKYDVDNAISANAQAIRNTETNVATIDDKVTAQATDILNLSNGLTNLNNSKLDASIIQQYRTAVDQDSVTAGELTQFKSTLKIGGDNLFTDTKTFNNEASENSTSSFYPSYGGFGGNTQEFLPNALFGTHTVVKTSSSWCGFYLREADGVSWEAQEDMVLSFWANASADVHVYGIASQLGHAATIPANQPMTKYEVLIPKGSPLRNSSNQGIIEFYLANGGELWYGAVMLQVGTKSTSWQPSSKDNELNTSQFASATALENLTTNVSNIDGVVSSHTNQINAHQASINTALDIITIRDTRYDNFPPSHYRKNYALKEVREFKVSGTISLPTWYPAYCTLVTRTQWTDASGGNVIQRVEFDDPTLNLYRKSNDGMVNWDTWSAWENKLVGSLSAKADASYVNEINNKVIQAENGLTALSNTVTENAASLVNNINLFRNSGFDATPIDGHHWQGVYWEGNEAVQMSVENWGHWNIMRIRAYADGQAFSGIAQELAFDDYRYTGKQLQFRFLTSSAITRNMRLGVHYRDGAGATAHQEWRTFTHTTGYTNLHTFTLPAVNGIYSLRVMITEETSQSAYDWALIQPSFNTGNAPIREYVPSSQDGLYVANAAATVTTQTRAEVSNLNGQVSSLASQTNTLATTVGNNTAAIQLQQSSIDGINAKATLQVEAGGTIGGVALGNNGGIVDAVWRADSFSIAPPISAGAGDVGKAAFNYRATPVTLPNGTVIPEGLYLNNLIVDYVDASRINAETISAISGELGTFTSVAADGSKTVMNGGLTLIYYPNGQLAGRIGVWG